MQRNHMVEDAQDLQVMAKMNELRDHAWSVELKCIQLLLDNRLELVVHLHLEEGK